jgi:hypothetical protein
MTPCDALLTFLGAQEKKKEKREKASSHASLLKSTRFLLGWRLANVKSFIILLPIGV